MGPCSTCEPFLFFVVFQVNNTDAEGRLTLADALIYACNQGVEKVMAYCWVVFFMFHLNAVFLDLSVDLYLHQFWLPTSITSVAWRPKFHDIEANSFLPSKHEWVCRKDNQVRLNIISMRTIIHPYLTIIFLQWRYLYHTLFHCYDLFTLLFIIFDSVILIFHLLLHADCWSGNTNWSLHCCSRAKYCR